MDLVNSEEWDTFGKRTEWLDDPSWLPYFLRQWRFAVRDRRPFPRARFMALRGVLRRSCEALAGGGRLAEKELRSLNVVMSVSGRRKLIHRQRGLQIEFVPEWPDWDWILGQIAQSFAELLAGNRADRIRICPNGDCRWVFYDGTKGRTRRWCSARICGNRERVRRARAKAAR